jgi:hypothetical protein
LQEVGYEVVEQQEVHTASSIRRRLRR